MYQLITEDSPPLTVQELSSWLKRPAGSSEDALLSDLIQSVTLWGESYVGRDFRDKEWKLSLDEFPSHGAPIQLQKREVDSVTIDYTDMDDNLVSFEDFSTLQKLTTSLLCPDTVWPAAKNVSVYINTKGIDPNRVRQPLLNHAASLYYNRGDMTVQSLSVHSGAAEFYKTIKLSAAKF